MTKYSAIFLSTFMLTTVTSLAGNDVYGLPVSESVDRYNNSSLLVIILVVALVMALAVVALLAVKLLRGTRRLKDMRSQLAEVNRRQDAHISHFLNLSSIYMNKLDEFTRIARRKISAGQVDDLLSLIKSGKMIDEQSSEFFEIFDSAFIDIYPSFVDDVNKLLRPDRQIVASSPDRLTTELRILAFMRLGIDDSARVAGFMGLSVNTIYTYRNKIKGKAVDRDTFEAGVMAIGL